MPSEDLRFMRELEDESDRDLVLSAMIALVSQDTKIPELVGVIGFDATLKLLLYYGGQHIVFPDPEILASAIDTAGAALAVFRERSAIRETARRFGVPERGVRKGVRVLVKQAELRRKMRGRYREAMRTPRVYPRRPSEPPS